MPPPSPNERSHLPSQGSYGSGRRTMYGGSQSARQTQYSSLGDALGGARQPQYNPGSDYPPPPGVAGGSIPPHPHMTSDGRHYYNPSGLPSYDYPYQPAPYETQYGHSSLPPMRRVSPAPAHASQSHPTSQYNPPTASYTSPYAQTQYAPIQGASQQWANNEWNQAQSFSPDAVQQPVFVTHRSDPTASPQTDPRAYVSPQYSTTSAGVHPTERNSSEFSPSSKGKARERESAQSERSPSSSFSPASADFPKARQPNVSGEALSLDDIERMLRSASLGLRMLNPASPPVAAQNRNPSEDSSNSTEFENISPKLSSKQSEAAPVPEGQTCLGCGATSTPEWRRGPLGPRTLCNACGLVYAKLIKKRSQEPNSITTPNQTHSHSMHFQTISEEAPSFGSPNNADSDDEHSYGSQDPL
ncbi:hypothetical protein DFH11DRAFT_1687940 [Phellopilus nigrolimitatus]|nr:hypothetical protein DFH11DRAFT_1687940 [Phellopilus nigrolimitatus]